MNKRNAMAVMAVVIFLIGIAAVYTTCIVPTPRGVLSANEARRKIARGEIHHLNVALKLYYLHLDAFPTTEQGLAALVENPGVTNWQGPYMEVEGEILDPWETPYEYSIVSNVPRIASAGADKRFGTEDDIAPE